MRGEREQQMRGEEEQQMREEGGGAADDGEGSSR